MYGPDASGFDIISNPPNLTLPPLPLVFQTSYNLICDLNHAKFSQ
jgi:hypothetical protein